MRSLLLLLALVPLAVAATTTTDPAGDERFVQLSPGPNLAPLLGGCSDPAMDMLGYDMSSDGNFINGSILIQDANATPTCGAVPMWRQDDAYISIRLLFSGSRFATVAYDFDDLCILSVWTGSTGSATTLFPGEVCDLENDAMTFSFPLAGNVGHVAYSFGGLTYDAFAESAEMISIVPVLEQPETFNGRIIDLAGVPGG